MSAAILAGLAAFLILWLTIEAVLHRRALAKIPIRIHVNGTRGKSSVCRLIVAGLRAGGKETMAKTTGTLARVILPTGRELGVYRPLGANVREQIRIVRFAKRLKAEALVIECMALQPYLQWMSEKMFVRATHGVITNARPDHLDVMGPEPVDVAKALCGMVPRGGKLFTAEQEHLAVLQEAASDRKTQLRSITDADVDAISSSELDGFEHFEHAENIALALAVCASLGIDRGAALAGMQAATPDPGALQLYELDYFGRKLVFANAFAANDPVSSTRIIELCRDLHPTLAPVLVFNCRADRVDRSRQLGESLAQWNDVAGVAAIGDGTTFLIRAAARAGFDATSIVNAEGAGVYATFERLIELCHRPTLLIGLGNIGGLGLELTRLFRNRAKPTALPKAPTGEEAA